MFERKRLIAQILANPLAPDVRHYVPKPLPPGARPVIGAGLELLPGGDDERRLPEREQGVGVPLQLPAGNSDEEMAKSIHEMVKAGIVKEFGEAALLFIELDGDGVIMVRYAADGDFAGDTWHPTVEEAQEEAKLEFENALSEWIEVPPDEKDVVAFALKAKW